MGSAPRGLISPFGYSMSAGLALRAGAGTRGSRTNLHCWQVGVQAQEQYPQGDFANTLENVYTMPSPEDFSLPVHNRGMKHRGYQVELRDSRRSSVILEEEFESFARLRLSNRN